MHRPNILAAALAAGTMIAAPALADGLYYGIGASVTSAESPLEFGDGSEGAFASLGFVIGYRKDSGSMFFGGEIDGDLSLGAELDGVFTGTPCSDGASAPYACSIDNTLRLRAIVGTAVSNNMELFATAGVVRVSGENANSPGTTEAMTNTGTTVGIGLQRENARGRTMRYELIMDRANTPDPDAEYEPGYESVTAKFSLMF